jgi:prevent-host-death family protein
MQTVGIKVLKNKLSEYIRMVADGETVQVTDRGRVVAEIVPPRAAAKATTPEERWQELIRQGLVRPATHRLEGPPPRLPDLVSFEELMRDLDESRSDR